jgi:hypothetical protein
MKLSIAFTILLATAQVAAAQSGTEGSILGNVKDSSGAAMPAVNVSVTNTETGIAQSVITDSAGYFQVLALPRGIYSVSVSAPNFSTWRLAQIELVAGEQKRIQPMLSPGDVKQEVTVQGATEVIQTERASVEMALSQKQIRELPLIGRDPLQMVNLVPGLRYLGITTPNVQGRQMQGLGQHSDATQFSIDGASANDPSTETGMGFPNLDSVAEFRVQTSSFSAENGRAPLQVTMITKSGTNAFHGTLWEFLRNDKLDARNTFLNTKEKLRRNQYGGSLGGRIIRNRTFFFTSFEGLKVRREGGYNSITIEPAFLQGNFSSLRTPVTDPAAANQPFPGNQIPAARFSNASKFFFPYILLPNAPNSRFQALASLPNDGTNFMLRLDQQFTTKQKAYIRWIRVADEQLTTGYRPDVENTSNLIQHNTAASYDWTVTPSVLITASAGFLFSDYGQVSPLVGKENLTEQAGVQGFATALRPTAIGLPSVNFTGYTGFSWAQQVPSSFKREVLSGRAGVTIIRGRHTLLAGGEYLDNQTNVAHSSANPRGTFTFNSQYTGNGFSDYLLGLVQTAAANAPLAAFGVAHAPYTGFYADDTWRVSSNLTINLGVRWDYWWEKSFIRGAGTTFDLKTGKAVAGENERGEVDLTAQPVAPFYGAATRDLWVSASQAGMPRGLFIANGYVSPRLGLAWRPLAKDTLVVRAGYGIFAASYNGNVTGSSIIGPPYWANQNITFARASNQRWETAFPANPANFVAPSIAAAVVDIKQMKVHEFNVSVQGAVPLIRSALTVSYVGSRGHDLTAFPRMNSAPPGNYPNLQAALPYPRFGTINMYQSIGRGWFNGLQTKLEKRFAQGLTYLFSYSLNRDISLFGSETTFAPTPHAPANYDRGTSPNERRHILSASGILEIPFGRGKRWGSDLNRVVNGVLGGWQLSGIYRFVAGPPLTLAVAGATLGNGTNARPNVLGDWQVPNPGPDRWFNPDAFGRPPLYQFGNSAPGAIVGPALHVLDSGLQKNFRFSEQRYLQFRWEMFNAMNEVNLGTPVAMIGVTTAGQITSAGEARQMQLGLKFVF